MATDWRPRPGMTLVWDVDDVLNALTRHWFEDAWRAEWPACRLAYGQLIENPPHRLLGVPKATFLASLDAFREARYATLEPDSRVLAWMRREGCRYRHLALTAVPLRAAHHSAAWVYRHWGTWIRGFHVVPSPRSDYPAPDWDASKVEYLRWLGHDDVVLIEDNPAALREAAAAGLRTLRVSQPWNDESVGRGQLEEFLN